MKVRFPAEKWLPAALLGLAGLSAGVAYFSEPTGKRLLWAGMSAGLTQAALTKVDHPWKPLAVWGVWICAAGVVSVSLFGQGGVPESYYAGQPLINTTVPARQKSNARRKIATPGVPADLRSLWDQLRDMVAPSAGVAVIDGRLVVHDWSAWMKHAPASLRRAIAAGATTAETVLAYTLAEAIPGYNWPPAQDSPMYPQWQTMIPVMVQLLDLESTTPVRKGLRLVTPST